MNDNRQFGLAAEEAACAYLQRAKFVILQRNYHTRYGELDIVAKEGNCLIFIEVKANHGRGTSPALRVGLLKQRRLIKAAQLFLNEHETTMDGVRFDVVSMRLSVRGDWKIELIRDAFRLDDSVWTFR
jgi:putative endonuclease